MEHVFIGDAYVLMRPSGGWYRRPGKGDVGKHHMLREGFGLSRTGLALRGGQVCL